MLPRGEARMLRRDFEKVLEQQSRAIEARSEFLAATDFNAAEKRWREFLFAFDRFLNKAYAASKTDTLAAPWYGGKLAARKNDELLSYLHLARDSAEHTLGEVAKEVPGELGLSSTGSTHIKGLKIVGGRIEIQATGSPLSVRFEPSGLALLPATSRGVTLHPPAGYQDKGAALRAADYAIAYASKLLAEMEERFVV